MQQRKVVFVTNEIYHVFNRSVGKEQIFTTLSYLKRISEAVNFYRYHQNLSLSAFKNLDEGAKQVYLYTLEKKMPLVEIYVFSFMPNHFHLLIKQLQEDGINEFISNVENSFAKYFNLKHDRHGSLFQSPFQARWIETDEQFIHVSRYAHINHVTSYIIPIESLFTYPFTSARDYIDTKQTPWLNTEFLSSMFSSKEKHREFIEDQVDYQRTLADIRDLTIE